MKPSPRVPGAIVLGAAAALATLVLVSGEDEPQRAESLGSANADGDAAATSVLDEPAPDPAPRAPAGEAAAEPSPRGPDPARAGWIEGRVLAGDDPLAGGDGIEVFLLARPLPLDAFLERRVPGGPEPSVLVARADADANGRFRLADERPGRPLWVLARGRHAYTPRPVAVTPYARSGGTELTVPARLGGWITGRVVPPDAGALTVLLREASPMGSGFLPHVEVARHGVDLGDGRFELRAVPPGGPYLVRVTPSARASVSATVRIAAGERVELELEPSAGVALAGRVVDGEEHPVADALVVAEVGRNPLAGRFGDPLRRTLSGADGRFELRALPTETKLDVRATKRGLLEAFGEARLAPGLPAEELVLRLGSGSSVSGVVRWPDGRPAAGVPVVARFDPSVGGLAAVREMRGATGAARTDGEGRFTVAGLGRGPFTLLACALEDGAELPRRWRLDGPVLGEGSGPSVADPFRLDPPHGAWFARADGVAAGRGDLELVLAAPLALDGRVVDASGHPVERFVVVATSRTGGMLEGRGALVVRTAAEDARGAFRLEGLRAGTWAISARADGYGPGERAVVRMPRPADEPLELVLASEARVTGEVVDATGAGVPGAEVTLRLDLEAKLRSAAAEERPPTAFAGPGGAFELGGLPAGEIELVATAPGFAPSEPLALALEAGASRPGARLVLRAGATLTGELYADSGEPAAGRTVLAQIPGRYASRQATTGAGGRFRFEHLPPGAWQVVAVPDGGALHGAPAEDAPNGPVQDGWRFASATLEEGGEAHVVLGAPPEDPVLVSGRVARGGLGVAGVLVSFLPEGGEGVSDFRLDSTGTDGDYAVVLDEPGRYLVALQSIGPTGPAMTLESVHAVPPGETHELDFSLPAGSIAGRVLGPDGEPCAKARVTLNAAGPRRAGGFRGGAWAETAADDEGRYLVEWLQPGRYVLTAGGAALGVSFGDDEPGRRSFGPVELSEDERLEGFDLRLGRPGSIEGLVVDAEGDPVEAAAVFVREPSGRVLDRLSRVATDGAGRFRYPGLAAGPYTVTARRAAGSAPLAAALEPSVLVEAGRDAEARVVLVPGTVLTVEVAPDEPGAGPPPARVAVRDAAGRRVDVLAAPDEVAASIGAADFRLTAWRVGPLAPGTYSVEVLADDGRRLREEVALDGRPERVLTLALPN